MEQDSHGFVIVNTKNLMVVHPAGMFAYPENGLLPPFPAWRTWEVANREFQVQKKCQTEMGIDFSYAIVPVSVLQAFKISAKD